MVQKRVNINKAKEKIAIVNEKLTCLC